MTELKLGHHHLNSQLDKRAISHDAWPMRDALQRIEGQRATFRAKFARFGKKPSRFRLPNGRLVEREVRTILLVDVVDAAGNEVTDHLWFACGKQFDDLALQAGDRVKFDAESAPYMKGYQGRSDDGEACRETDYRLRLPTRVSKVSAQSVAQSVAQLPLFAIPVGANR